MFHRSAFFAVLVLVVGCTTVQPSRGTLELFVNYSSGGDWPTGTSARIYSDGTLELGDGVGLVRRRISTTHPIFLRVKGALETPSFHQEISAAAIPSEEWRSSGARIRLERLDTVALVKPPVKPPQIRALLNDVNLLFAEIFGRRYGIVEID